MPPKKMPPRQPFLAACLFLTACASSQAEPATAKPSPVGAWKIQATDVEGTRWAGVMVLKTTDKGAIVGTIDWTATGGKFDGASGREHVSVTYFPGGRNFKMNGEKLADAKGITLGAYTAELSADGNLLVKGKWATVGLPGVWGARRASPGCD